MAISPHPSPPVSGSPPLEEQSFRIEVLRTIEQIEARKNSWDQFLATSAGEHAYMHDHTLIVRDLQLNASTFSPLFLIEWEGDQIQSIAPFYVERQAYGIRLGVLRVAAPTLRMLKIFGGSIVHRRGRSVEMGLERIFNALRSWRQEFDTITFFELPVGGDVWNYFHDVGGARHGFRLETATASTSVLHFVELADSYDAYLASFNSRRRKAWRKDIRQFEALCPSGYEVVRVTDEDAAGGFLEDVDRVFPTTWQANVFASQRHVKPSNADYYRTVAKRGWFRAYTLKVGGTPIAFSAGFQHQGIYYFDETGYDTAWRDGNPGTVLLLRIMEDLHAHDPPRICHFGYGDGLQKRTFGTYSVDVAVVHLISVDSMYARTVVGLARWMDGVSDAIRRFVTKIGIDTWLRDRLKRGRWFGGRSVQ